ncbi:MAG: extracellular solute-binding protein [Gammaproteobacteria bacterium]|nr:extracellular solute-binding protein [Gammaproteobacteria bacterium]
MIALLQSLAAALLWVLLMMPSQAAPALALGYTPVYPPGFTHFHYVNPEAPKGGELLMSAFGSFDSLNPFLLKGLPAAGLSLLVFESLLEKSLDEPFSMYGLLAEDVDLAEDGLSVTFRLRPQARFSDGTPVTAQDVKFSFDTLRSTPAHPMYRFYWADVERAEVLDVRTVRFVFKRTNPELHLILGEMPVLSERWVNGRSFDQLARVVPVGSGPYVVESFAWGKQIRYRRNPDYWAQDLPVRRGMFNFDRISFKYYKDRTVSLEAFKAGEFEFFYENHSKRWARDHEGPRYASGEIIKTTIPHHNNAGMQGIVFNTRRALFQDRRVREALGLAMDFEWSNRNLFYGQYTRCDSYFSNSELAAQGLPQGEELALLEPYRDQLPPEVFTHEFKPPVAGDAAKLRDNLIRAKHLLEEAGWRVRDGVLVNAEGRPFRFEILLGQKGFERVMAPYVYNLRKLGIQADYRTIDAALYQRRVDTFDFDAVIEVFGQSQSPGNELFNMFHSQSADREGSNNYMGVKDPVVDALVEKIVYAKDRQSLVTAAHALDRVLLWGHYLVPNWYIGVHRIAYWDKFGRPAVLPLYFEAEPWVLKTWWHKP